MTYVVCDALLDAETNEHCEFDEDVVVDFDGGWRCPACHRIRHHNLTAEERLLLAIFGDRSASSSASSSTTGDTP